LFRRDAARGLVMAVPVHLLIFLSYTLAAAATPFALHLGIGGIDLNVAAMSGGLVGRAGMVMHEVAVRFRQQARPSDEIILQRAAYDRVMGELDGARASLKLVPPALEAAAAKRNRASRCGWRLITSLCSWTRWKASWT